MSTSLYQKAACIDHLKLLAYTRLPGFVFDYLKGGCNSDLAVSNNRTCLDAIQLDPHLLESTQKADAQCEILGQSYAAPFGIAPIGLSGLIWPKASVYQARAAQAARIPFVLSTLSSVSIERAADNAEEYLWFQLYPPTDKKILKDLIDRVKAVDCQNLVVTIDVPTLGKRPNDIRNGLSVPPRLGVKSLIQMMRHPQWLYSTLRNGKPKFETLIPYIDSKMDNLALSHFIRDTLKDVVDLNLLQEIRDMWPHNLIVKGVLNSVDAESAIQAGADAIIVSNHGGRQLDAAVSPIEVISQISQTVSGRIPVMADSGVESGVDVARFIAQGAEMVFCGRAMMYGVAALGAAGAPHVIDIIRGEYLQVMNQLHCEHNADLPNHRVF